MEDYIKQWRLKVPQTFEEDSKFRFQMRSFALFEIMKVVKRDRRVQEKEKNITIIGEDSTSLSEMDMMKYQDCGQRGIIREMEYGYYKMARLLLTSKEHQNRHEIEEIRSRNAKSAEQAWTNYLENEYKFLIVSKWNDLFGEAPTSPDDATVPFIQKFLLELRLQGYPSDTPENRMKSLEAIHDCVKESITKAKIVNGWTARGLVIPSDFDAKLPTDKFIQRFLVEVSNQIWNLGSAVAIYSFDTPEQRMESLTCILKEVNDEDNYPKTV